MLRNKTHFKKTRSLEGTPAAHGLPLFFVILLASALLFLPTSFAARLGAATLKTDTAPSYETTTRLKKELPERWTQGRQEISFDHMFRTKR